MTSISTTPAERRRLKIRERILSTAEHVFAEEGAEGLSIRRLAEKIDYSPSAIYKYFKSKDELVDELKESFFELILEQTHSITETSKPFAERARLCIAAYVRVAAEKPHHYMAAFTGTALQDGPSDTDPGFETTKKGQAFLVLRGMIEEGIEVGAFRKDLDPGLSAKSMWASMHGLALMIAHIPSYPALKPGNNTISRDEFIDLHADQVIRGLEAL